MLRKSTIIFLIVLTLLCVYMLSTNMDTSQTLLVVFGIYVVRGIFVVISDMAQPYHNRPQYIHEKKYSMYLVKIILWPIMH